MRLGNATTRELLLELEERFTIRTHAMTGTAGERSNAALSLVRIRRILADLGPSALAGTNPKEGP